MKITCSANSVQDGDSHLCASVHQRGGFPSFHRSEGRVFPDTCSPVVEEAIEVHVGRDSLPVQGPVFRTVDCPTGFHQGVFRCVCVDALLRDSSSSVPGRLAGPRLFGGGGKKDRPGSVLSLSLPRDRDKRGEVRSRTLADSALPRYDHRCRGRQDFSVSCASREISVGGRDVLCYVSSPSSPLAGDFGSPGFAGEDSSSQSSLNALPSVAFEDSLVPLVGSSFPSGASVPGGEGGFVLVDGEVPSSQAGSIRDTCSQHSPVLRRILVVMGHTPPRPSSVRGVVGAGEVAAHQSSGNEGNVSGIAVISGVGCWSPCDHDVRQLDGCRLRQQAGRDGLPSLCSLASRLLRWAESLDVHLDARYIPGQSIVLADLLSRWDQVIGTEWSLHPWVARDLHRRWGSHQSTCSRRVTTRASPVLFPCPGSPGGLRGCVPSFLGQPGPVRVSTLSSGRKGGGLSRRDPQSLHDSGRPPLPREGVVRRPPSTDPTTSGASVVGPVVVAAPLQQVPQRHPCGGGGGGPTPPASYRPVVSTLTTSSYLSRWDMLYLFFDKY